MDPETQKELKILKRRIKKLEEVVEGRNALAVDYEVLTDDKLNDLYKSLKLVAQKVSVDIPYEWGKGSIKKKSKSKKSKSKKSKSKKSRKKKRTRGN
jgi:hypothetical protein